MEIVLVLVEHSAEENIADVFDKMMSIVFRDITGV